MPQAYGYLQDCIVLLDNLDSATFIPTVDIATQCLSWQHTKRHELWQVKLCFNKSLALVDCDGIVLERGGRALEVDAKDMDDDSEREAMGNCPTDGIIYPSSVR